MSDASRIRIEDRPAASNVAIFVSGSAFAFPEQGSSFGFFLDPPSEEATPTLGDIYSQMVASRAENQVNYVSITHGIDRIIAATSRTSTHPEVVTGSVSNPKERLASRSVSLKGVTRSVSGCVIVLCLLSLALWALEGFILINPAACVVALVGSVMALIMSPFIATPAGK